MGRFGKSQIQLLLLVAVAAVCFAADNLKLQPNRLFTHFDPNNTPEWKNPEMTQQPALPSAAASSNVENVRFSTVASSAPLFPPTADNYSGAPAVAVAASAVVDDRISDYIADSVLHFAHQLGQQLAETAYSKTEIFSPTSIMSALSLLMLGAKGRSYHELKKLFGLDDSNLAYDPSKFHEQFGHILEDIQDFSGSAGKRKNAIWRNTDSSKNIRGQPMPAAAAVERKKYAEQLVQVANGLFAQIGYNLNPDYSEVIRSVYHAQLEPLDFQQHSTAARDHINDWVARNTYGKIPNIITGEIASSTNIIMASALYFKGFWENSFFEAATQSDSFYPDGPTQAEVQVQMMATGGMFPFYNSIENDCRIIGLPYKGNATTMYVIQPNQSTRARLRQLQKQLDSRKIEDMISRMKQSTAVIAFPKMHIVRDINMKQFLSRLGVNDIFFSGISDLSLIATANQMIGQRPVAAGAAPSQRPFATWKSQPTIGNRSIPDVLAPPCDCANDQQVGIKGGRSSRSQYSGSSSDQQVGIKGGSSTRSKRAAFGPLFDRRSSRLHNSLKHLEAQRISEQGSISDLFVEDIVHKVDFDVNEQGTEAAAATLTYLRRSGTDVLFRADTPFMLLIRHDPTKLVLFYGLINEPEL